MKKILWQLICILGCAICGLVGDVYDATVIGECIVDTQSQRKMVKIVLPNGLQALAVSDPGIAYPSASIAIETGSWDDPFECPGMAHFVEHLLFLGSRKYPAEEEYSRYIQDGGGLYNGATAQDRSWFSLCIRQEFFEGALDRFSQLFIDPVFSSSAIAREQYAVHHEFEEGLEENFYRIWRIFKETGNLEHPNARFSCGNLQTLQSVTPEEVRAWFEKHYQPRYMRLVIVSQEPLQNIVRQACEYFSKIPVRDLDRVRNHEQTLSSSRQKGHFVYVKPVLEEKHLLLMWETTLPQDQTACAVLEEIFEQNHQHNLERLLVKKHLARGTEAFFLSIGKQNGFFSLSIDLTEQGVLQVDEVIKTCFQFIASLKEVDFSFYVEEKGLQGSYAENLAKQLLDEDFRLYPQKQSRDVEEINAQISNFLDQFTPKECTYFFVAPFEQVKVEPSYIEKWMGSEYAIRAICPLKLQAWENLLAYPDFALPIFEEEEEEEEKGDRTWFSLKTSRGQGWGDLCFTEKEQGTTIEASFSLDSPSFAETRESAICGTVFLQHLKSLFSEEEVAINFFNGGVEISMKCPRKQWDSFIVSVFKKIKETKLSREEFELAKRAFVSGYSGDEEPIETLQQLRTACLSQFYYTSREVYQNIFSVSYIDFLQWQQKCWKQLSLYGSITGTNSKKKNAEFSQKICTLFSPEPYKKKKSIETEQLDGKCLIQKTHRKGNGVLLSIVSDYKNKASLIFSILDSIVEQAFFHELRTNQQVAYQLYSDCRYHGHKVEYDFYLQSTSYSVRELLTRVESFLDDFSKNSHQYISRERFDYIYRATLLDLLEQKNESDTQEQRAVVENKIRELKNISLEDVLCAINQIFSPVSRKKVAFLLEGTKHSFITDRELREMGYMKMERIDIF